MKTSIAVCVFLLAACGGGDSEQGQAGPANPQAIGQRPDDAQMTGTQTQASIPGGPSFGTGQAGDAGDAVWCWYADADEDGEDEDCCAIEDDETGVGITWCVGYDDECDDGTPIEGAILIVILDEDGSGAFAIAGDDVCGSGADLAGCEFDAGGDLGDCGICSAEGEDLECLADDGGDDGDGDDGDDGDDGA